VTGYFLIIGSGCRNEKINFTSSYIELMNETKFLNGFHVARLEISDSLIPPGRYSEMINEKYGILTDESFKLEKRIYFDRPQQGLTWVKLDGLGRLEYIGLLKTKSWYLFTNLHPSGFNIFVYIDEEGNAKSFVDHRTNW
jgi:hypothetical protein